MKYILLLLLFVQPCFGLQVNEILYNPDGSDNGKEFIEIIGNIANHSVGDLMSNDSLTLIHNYSSNFSLIVSEGFNYSGINASIYEVTGNIGNGLGNSGDSIFLYFNNSIVLNFSYENIVASGYSLEYYNGNYVQSLVVNGTPGSINSHFLDNVVNTTVNITINKTANQTVNQTNSTNETTTCNVSLDLEIEKQVYEEGEKIVFENVVDYDDFVVEYWVENLDGEIIKKKINTTNDSPKQYTPKEKILIFRNKLYVDCNNTGNEENSVLVVAKVEENHCEKESDRIKKLEKEVSKKPKLSCGSSSKTITISKGSIESFYTRKKNYESVINLFTKIKGKGFYTLYINSQIEDYNRTVVINNSETIELDVRAEQGKNLYTLELIDAHGKVLDIERLAVYFPEKKEVEVPVKVEQKFKEEKEKTVEIPPITSNVIYEQEKSSLPTNLLIGTFVVGILVSLFLLVKYIKPSLFDQNHGQERDQEEDRRRVDPSQHDLRDYWQPEGTRRGRFEKLHGEYQN